MTTSKQVKASIKFASIFLHMYCCHAALSWSTDRLWMYSCKMCFCLTWIASNCVCVLVYAWMLFHVCMSTHLSVHVHISSGLPWAVEVFFTLSEIFADSLCFHLLSEVLMHREPLQLLIHLWWGVRVVSYLGERTMDRAPGIGVSLS